MNYLQKLLPPSISASEVMQAAAQAVGDELVTTDRLIPNIHIWSQIDELSEDILDHLGWQLHIDGWEYADSKEKKAWLVKNMFDWHRYKGTVYGHRIYWQVLLERTLLAASPPHKSFLGTSITPAERAAFEAPHPEIRLYPFRKSGTKKGGFFVGDGLGVPAEGYGVFPVPSDALLRIGHRVELYDPVFDESTPLHSLLYEGENIERLAQDVVEIRKPGKAVGFFCGGFLPAPTVDHGAKDRLYTIKLLRPYQTEIERRSPMTIQPSLAPLSVYHREGRKAGQAYGFFPANRWPDKYPKKGGKAFMGVDFPVRQRAGDRVFKFLKLFDPARAVPTSRHAHCFLGAFRLGPLPPHTAEVAVDAQGEKPRRGMHLSMANFCGVDFPYQSDAAARIARICHVGRLAKRRSDKVLLAITNRKRLKASPGVLAGTVKAGEYKLEVF